MAGPLDDAKLGPALRRLDELACSGHGHDGVIGAVDDHEPTALERGQSAEGVERQHSTRGGVDTLFFEDQ